MLDHHVGSPNIVTSKSWVKLESVVKYWVRRPYHSFNMRYCFNCWIIIPPLPALFATWIRIRLPLVGAKFVLYYCTVTSIPEHLQIQFRHLNLWQRKWRKPKLFPTIVPLFLVLSSIWVIFSSLLHYIPKKQCRKSRLCRSDF